MSDFHKTLRDLNDAAYSAAKAARKAGDPLAFELAQIARRTDEITDAAQPAHDPEPAA